MTGTTDKATDRKGADRAARSRTTGTVSGGPPAARPSGTAEPHQATRRELRMDQLLSAVENELIPRLLVSHSGDVEGPTELAPVPAAGPWASQDAIESFARLCIEDTGDVLNRCVSELLSRDIGLDAVYLHLIAPVARHLGEQWSADELSFVDVQLGLCRLHRLVCECGPVGFQREDEGGAFSILLSTVPGDQHTFGVTLAADFFRRYGWQVSNLAGLDRDFLLERIAATEYSAVGFSLHNVDFVDSLPALIRTVRSRSRNPDVLVLVGGDYFVRHPEAAERVGADLTAGDAHRAVAAAESRLRALAGGSA